MRTCKACGCYIPDLWGVCPGCGAIEKQKSDSVERFAPDRYEVRGGRGNEDVMHFPVQRPKTVLRRQDGESEDLDLLDEPDAEIMTRAIAYRGLGGNAAIQESYRFTSTWSSDPNVEPYSIELVELGLTGGELSKISKPPPLPTVFTR